MVSGRFYYFGIVIGREKPHVIAWCLLFERKVFFDQWSGYLCAGHPSPALRFSHSRPRTYVNIIFPYLVADPGFPRQGASFQRGSIHVPIIRQFFGKKCMRISGRERVGGRRGQGRCQNWCNLFIQVFPIHVSGLVCLIRSNLNSTEFLPMTHINMKLLSVDKRNEFHSKNKRWVCNTVWLNKHFTRGITKEIWKANLISYLMWFVSRKLW